LTRHSPHDALDALYVGIKKSKVNWVLDADIRGFFDAMDHEWLMKFVEHRIGDQRVLRLIRKWLKAGVLEGGEWQRTEKGSPQGASISPLLANIYLHYVFDLWAHRWRGTECRGDVRIVRYVDDIVVGFQDRQEADRFLSDLRERFAKFGLELHPKKTRLLEFGRFASRRRKKHGLGKPETFDFLGFTHSCGQTRKGKYQVVRRTMARRFRAKLAEVKAELKRRRHFSVPQQGAWLRAVLMGHHRYYGVPGNAKALQRFQQQAVRLWQRSLSKRSQKAHVLWARMLRYVARWLPTPRIHHPYPDVRFGVPTQGRSPVR